MKKLVFTFFLNILVLTPLLISADTKGLPGQPSSSINTPSANPFPSEAPKKEKPLPHPKRPLPEVSTPVAGVPFTLPGIVGIRNGRWAGSDNLYNVRPEISIYVEVVLPEKSNIILDEGVINSRIQQIFSKVGISPAALHEIGEPPMPLFHVLIFVDSIEQFNVASCACRLFESVKLNRMQLEPGIIFQAITWEKQELITSTKKEFNDVLNKTVDDLANTFVERFQYFQNLRLQRQSDH